MYRDQFVVPVRRRYSVLGGAKFVYLAEAIGRAHEPTPTQLDDLDRAYRATGEYLTTCPEFGRASSAPWSGRSRSSAKVSTST